MIRWIRPGARRPEGQARRVRIPAIARLFPTRACRIVGLFSALPPGDQRQLADLCRTLGRSLSKGAQNT